jgi:hypothetical protein
VTSAAPFSYYFCHPVFQNAWTLERNARPYIFFKALLLYAAGIDFKAPDAHVKLQQAQSVPVLPTDVNTQPERMTFGDHRRTVSLNNDWTAMQQTRVREDAGSPLLAMKQDSSAH